MPQPSLIAVAAAGAALVAYLVAMVTAMGAGPAVGTWAREAWALLYLGLALLSGAVWWAVFYRINRVFENRWLRRHNPLIRRLRREGKD